MKKDPFMPVGRRTVLKIGVAAGLTSGLSSASTAFERMTSEQEPAPVRMSTTLTVNGRTHRLELDTRTSVLDTLREHLGLTGAKKGCDHGQCGACTVLLNGRRINACLTLAVMHDGDEITTIEGLGTPDRLSPLQAAFVEQDGLQCGYCTPGQICSAAGMLTEHADGWPSYATPDVRPTTPAELTDDEIRERMSGNICRCCAYDNIVAAIREARKRTA